MIFLRVMKSSLIYIHACFISYYADRQVGLQPNFIQTFGKLQNIVEASAKIKKSYCVSGILKFINI